MFFASGGSICAIIGGGTLLIVVVCTMSQAFCLVRNSIAMRPISGVSAARTYWTLMPVASVKILNSGRPSCSFVEE